MKSEVGNQKLEWPFSAFVHDLQNASKFLFLFKL